MDADVKAVIFGLPLVMMDLTRKRTTNVKRHYGIAAPINQFGHAPMFPPASFKDVVRANVDTLYSSAFLDLSTEPQALSVPDTGGRYYLMPMLDAWTNVFATPGARTTGVKAADFVITGPDWRGTLPAGAHLIRSPTNMAWILGRTQTNGPGDYAAVQGVQAGFRLSPLSQFGAPYVGPEGNVDPGLDMKTPPVEQLRRMSGTAFLTELARLLTLHPPRERDAPMLAPLAEVGVTPGRPFDARALDPATLKKWEDVVPRALKVLQGEAGRMGQEVNGWRIPKSNIADFGVDYETRAFIALIALGANLPADSLYPTAFVDGDDKPLNGADRYVLRFGPNLTPPVNAFWSVTMYDAQSFFVENSLKRYAISSWMPLVRDDDGSLAISIQHAPPDAQANWLPAPEGPFNVTMRMYWPKAERPSILDGSWAPPAIEKVA